MVTPTFASRAASNFSQSFDPWRMIIFLVIPFERFGHQERPPKTLLLTGLCCSLSRSRSAHSRSMPLSILSKSASADVVDPCPLKLPDFPALSLNLGAHPFDLFPNLIKLHDGLARQCLFDLLENSNDRAPFSFEKPQAVPKTYDFSLSCGVHDVHSALKTNVNEKRTKFKPLGFGSAAHSSY
jgi:hypothetical protein